MNLKKSARQATRSEGRPSNREYPHGVDVKVDSFIAETLTPVIHEIAEGDLDGVFAFCGRERIGKSTLTLALDVWESRLIAKLTGREPWEVFALSHVAQTPDKYSELNDNMPLKSVLHYDEGGTGMYNRRAMSKSNVGLNQMLMTCGANNHVHNVCMQSFAALDPDVRYRRILGVFNVFAHVDERGGMPKLVRGFADYYSGEDIGRIRVDQETRLTIWPKPRYPTIRFGDFPACPFFAAYKEESRLAKRVVGRGVSESLRAKP